MKPLDPTAGPVPEFAHQLRVARERAGNPPFRDMAKISHFAAPTLSVAAGGRKLPTWECTQGYLRACNITDEAEVADWRERWERVRDQHTENRKVSSKSAQTSGATSATTLPTLQGGPLPQVAAGQLRASIDSTQEFIDALNVLRTQQGLSYRAVAQRSRNLAMPDLSGGELQQLYRSTVHDVLSGRRRLTPQFVRLYLNACGVNPDEIASWLKLLRQVQGQERREAADVIGERTAAPPSESPQDVYAAAAGRLARAFRGAARPGEITEATTALIAALAALPVQDQEKLRAQAGLVFRPLWPAIDSFHAARPARKHLGTRGTRRRRARPTLRQRIRNLRDDVLPVLGMLFRYACRTVLASMTAAVVVAAITIGYLYFPDDVPDNTLVLADGVRPEYTDREGFGRYTWRLTSGTDTRTTFHAKRGIPVHHLTGMLTVDSAPPLQACAISVEIVIEVNGQLVARRILGSGNTDPTILDLDTVTIPQTTIDQINITFQQVRTLGCAANLEWIKPGLDQNFAQKLHTLGRGLTGA